MDLARSTRHWRTIKGYEMMNMMHKGKLKKVRKEEVREHVKFMHQILE